jgi:diacylglycerol kinase (ATP)
MAPSDRLLIIHNPTAGRGRAAKRLAQLESALREAGLAYDSVCTESHGQAVALAAKGRRDGYSAIIAAGGDGTINEVINGVASVDTMDEPADRPLGPIAVWPIGSGNDLAHTLGSRLDPSALVAGIVSDRTRRVDLGLATLRGPGGEIRRYFHNSLGYGLEASVTQESQRIQKVHGGLRYLAAAIRALGSYDSPQTTIEWLDEAGATERMEQEITILSIGNARRTGGAFYLTPNAELDDALFDVALAGSMSRIRLLSLLPRALVGKHTGARSVRMLRCRQIRACSVSPLPVHMDGEVVMRDALEAEAVVVPGHLEIIV